MKHCLSLDVVMPLCTHHTHEVRFNPCKIRFFFKMFKSDMTPEPRGDVTRSPKQRYQWCHKKDLCPQN